MKPFFEDGDRVQLYQGDCLEVMPKLEGTFDAIVCDLPYGQVACSWDVVIPFELLWECYKRLIKPNGAIVLFGSQPFTSALVMSNPKWFRYEWIWEKNRGSNFAATQYQPMKEHESILVFSQKSHAYNAQLIPRSESGSSRAKYSINPSNTGKRDFLNGLKTKKVQTLDQSLRQPSSVLHFNTQVGCHPTQKPLDLLAYILKTYSLPGERILDNTAGSFSTGVAAILNGRRFVGIEREEKYCRIGEKRIRDAITEVDSMLIKPWEIDSQPIAQPQQLDLLELA